MSSLILPSIRCFFFKMESRLYDEKEDHRVDSFYLIALDIPEILP